MLIRWWDEFNSRQEEHAQDDDYEESIQMPDPLQQTIESSAGDTSAIRERLRDSVVDDFYKHVVHEPLIKDYNNFEYKNDILYKRQRKNQTK